jgi:hypothetical protein
LAQEVVHMAKLVDEGLLEESEWCRPSSTSYSKKSTI